MKKRIGYRNGVLYEGWEGQVKKCGIWWTHCYFDSKEDAVWWINH